MDEQEQTLLKDLELYSKYNYKNYNELTKDIDDKNATMLRVKELTYKLFNLIEFIVPGINARNEKMQEIVHQLRDKTVILEKENKELKSKHIDNDHLRAQLEDSTRMWVHFEKELKQAKREQELEINNSDCNVLTKTLALREQELDVKNAEIKRLQSEYSFKEVERQKDFINVQKGLLEKLQLQVNELKEKKKQITHERDDLEYNNKKLKLFITYLEDHRITDEDYIKLRDLSDERQFELSQLLQEHVSFTKSIETEFYMKHRKSEHKYEENNNKWFIEKLAKLTYKREASRKHWGDTCKFCVPPGYNSSCKICDNQFRDFTIKYKDLVLDFIEKNKGKITTDEKEDKDEESDEECDEDEETEIDDESYVESVELSDATE